MSFSLGIIGLPNVGKSTIFQALTKNKVATENRNCQIKTVIVFQLSIITII